MTKVFAFFKFILKQINWFYLFFIFFIFLDFYPETEVFLENFCVINPYYMFCIGFLIVSFRLLLKWDSNNTYVYDLKLNFLKLKLKHLIKYVNFLKLNLTKIYVYLVDYKSYSLLKSIYFFSSFFQKSFLMWRPLFKRFSYFGNYKLSRSYFIK